ncbi:MAG TPA: ATP-grasp domain-containing protein [Candidatus Acidoferrum sp.]
MGLGLSVNGQNWGTERGIILGRLATNENDGPQSFDVPLEFLKRQIRRRTLSQASSDTLPAFIKPVTPKQFRAGVYRSNDELAAECLGLNPETAVFVSEPVTLRAEVRGFVLDGRVLDAAIYEGEANAADAEALVTALASEISLLRAVVVDVGLIDVRGWGVIECNAAWGAGLNGCDPNKVLAAIVAASEPTSEAH